MSNEKKFYLISSPASMPGPISSGVVEWKPGQFALVSSTTEHRSADPDNTGWYTPVTRGHAEGLGVWEKGAFAPHTISKEEAINLLKKAAWDDEVGHEAGLAEYWVGQL